ncbi:MAG: exodeoxyribonuclease V subunit alpha [Nitrospirae bacterium]|nr:exodeoxyribonuclease V subunit alpha [Nitrospirota bacterium]
MSDARLFSRLSPPLTAWFSRTSERGILSPVDRALAASLVALEEGVSREDLDVYAVSVALVSAASRDGHTLLDLGERASSPYLEDLPDGLPAPSRWSRILASVAGSPGRPAPVILEREGLYLNRHYHAEVRVAEAVARRLIRDRRGVPLRVFDPSAPNSLLDRFFPLAGSPSDPVNAGREAARAALSRSLLLLTGGPGTGKTWTAARILALHRSLFPGSRIVAAAPTGKAAARMAEALSRAGFPGDPPPTMTLHRLLGAGRRGFARSLENPLDWDLVLVDELSMVDLSLMDRLLVALPESSGLVLTGDRDQLSSVGTGSVMSDLCATLQGSGGGSPEPGALTVLTHNFRQSGSPGLQSFAAAVAAGDHARVLALLEKGEGGLSLLPAAPGSPLPLDPLRTGWEGLPIPSERDPSTLSLDSFMALTPLREGPAGSLAINRSLQGHLRRRQGSLPLASPVIILENSYETGLMNGDLGVLLQSTLLVRKGGERISLPARLAPRWDYAYAMTVHKSQGSEFDHVVLLVGALDHPLLTRSLLYTGATRAKNRLTVWASREILERMVRRPLERLSALSERLGDLLYRPS